MAAAEHAEETETLTPEELAEIKKLVGEFRELREYMPVLRALKLLVSAAPPVGTPKVERKKHAPLTAEQHARVNAQLEKVLRRQELKK